MVTQIKWFLYLPFSLFSVAHADVIVDGSLSGSQQNLSGPSYSISESLGLRKGSNVFHSFSQFNINAGEEANFITSRPTQNILVRVTGGNSSLIDGTISANSFANLWLMNSAGWVVGKNAKLNVNGALHLSTANGIGFTDSTTFFADPASQSVLSSTIPLDYQFTSNIQTKITIDQADLVMPDNHILSLVGGDIDIKNAHISAPGGSLLLASNQGEGQWRFNGEELTQASGSGGIINIEHDDTSSASLSNPSLTTSRAKSDDFPSMSAGTLQITSGQINLRNAYILAESWNNQDGGDSTLRANQINFFSSKVNHDASGISNAGSVHVFANNLVLEKESKISTDTKNIPMEKTGNGGNVNINLTGQLNMSEKSKLSSFAGSGDGGEINIRANSIALKDNANMEVNTTGNSDAGNLNIVTNQFFMADGSSLGTSAQDNKGNGGNILIQAGDLVLIQKGMISSESYEDSQGNAGNIDIRAHNLWLSYGSQLLGESEGSGKAGRIQLTVGNTLHMQQGSSVSTKAQKTNGGPININSKILVLEHSKIETSVEGLQGDGGNINIDTETLVMNGGFIQANTAAAGANGGDIQINAENTLASQETILTGGDVRQEFTPISTLNIIQAAAPDGVSGHVNLSTVELNIAGQLAKIEPRFILQAKIANNPCQIERNKEASSLVSTKGKVDLLFKASDSANLPLQPQLGQKDEVALASNACQQGE